MRGGYNGEVTVNNDNILKLIEYYNDLHKDLKPDYKEKILNEFLPGQLGISKGSITDITDFETYFKNINNWNLTCVTLEYWIPEYNKYKLTSQEYTDNDIYDVYDVINKKLTTSDAIIKDSVDDLKADDTTIRKWVKDDNKLDSIENWDVSNVTDMSTLFMGMTNTKINKNLSNWDVSKVKTMKDMFSDCIVFNNGGELNASANQQIMNATKIRTINEMKQTVPIIEHAGKSGYPLTWNLHALESAEGMFMNSSINTQIVFTKLNNLKNVENMFNNCKLFNNGGKLGESGPKLEWDLPIIENMGWMFYNCHFLNVEINFTGLQELTTMKKMFTRCYNFNNGEKHNNVTINVIEEGNVQPHKCGPPGPTFTMNSKSLILVADMFAQCINFNCTIAILSDGECVNRLKMNQENPPDGSGWNTAYMHNHTMLVDCYSFNNGGKLNEIPDEVKQYIKMPNDNILCSEG
jgi:surface protein